MPATPTGVLLWAAMICQSLALYAWLGSQAASMLGEAGTASALIALAADWLYAGVLLGALLFAGHAIHALSPRPPLRT